MGLHRGQAVLRKHLRTFEEKTKLAVSYGEPSVKGHAKNSSILQCQKIPEGIRIRLENHVVQPTGNSKRPIFSTENFSKNEKKIEEIFEKIF